LFIRLKNYFCSISTILHTSLNYLKGVGPLRADVLAKELNLFNFGDLLNFFPFRHIDKTQINTINQINGQTEYVQLVGRIIYKEVVGEKQSKRLVAKFTDDTGTIDLVWFRGIAWVEKYIDSGSRFLIYGKVAFFMGAPQISHPEMELRQPDDVQTKMVLEPVYSSTEASCKKLER
jgi:ATP-dependent DNA helicase RecG